MYYMKDAPLCQALVSEAPQALPSPTDEDRISGWWL